MAVRQILRPERRTANRKNKVCCVGMSRKKQGVFYYYEQEGQGVFRMHEQEGKGVLSYFEQEGQGVCLLVQVGRGEESSVSTSRKDRECFVIMSGKGWCEQEGQGAFC